MFFLLLLIVGFVILTGAEDGHQVSRAGGCASCGSAPQRCVGRARVEAPHQRSCCHAQEGLAPEKEAERHGQLIIDLNLILYASAYPALIQ